MGQQGVPSGKTGFLRGVGKVERKCFSWPTHPWGTPLGPWGALSKEGIKTLLSPFLSSLLSIWVPGFFHGPTRWGIPFPWWGCGVDHLGNFTFWIYFSQDHENSVKMSGKHLEFNCSIQSLKWEIEAFWACKWKDGAHGVPSRTFVELYIQTMQPDPVGDHGNTISMDSSGNSSGFLGDPMGSPGNPMGFHGKSVKGLKMIGDSSDWAENLGIYRSRRARSI